MGNRIKELRLNAGMTLMDVANALGVSEGTAQRYESGGIRNLKYDTIVMLANLFQVSPAYLLGWDEDETIENRDDMYYLDPEAAEMANELFHRPEMRILFDASRKLTKEDIEMVTALVEKMSGK